VGTPEELNVLDNDAYRFRKPRQARGQEKFDRILRAADDLVVENGADELSLYDVAERAGVAVGSVYHFFPSKHAVLLALVEHYDRKFEEIVNLLEEGVQFNSWQDVLWQQTEQSRSYINSTPGALIMILGSGQTWATRLRDEEGDRDIAQSMATAIQRHFELPDTPPPDQLLFNAIRILESLWATSYIKTGEVTEEWARETQKALCAYLGLYWPLYLPQANH
jgi:AcrR family transcriptional regulator